MKPGESPETEAWVDPIVAEVRRARETLLADAGGDLDALCDRLRDEEARSGHAVVTRPSRAPDELPEVAA